MDDFSDDFDRTGTMGELGADSADPDESFGVEQTVEQFDDSDLDAEELEEDHEEAEQFEEDADEEMHDRGTLTYNLPPQKPS